MWVYLVVCLLIQAPKCNLSLIGYLHKPLLMLALSKQDLGSTLQSCCTHSAASQVLILSLIALVPDAKNQAAEVQALKRTLADAHSWEAAEVKRCLAESHAKSDNAKLRVAMVRHNA